MRSVAVLGSGIAGIMASYYFAKQGRRVTVYDRERYAAMRTSYANGGQISVSNSEVWTTWSTVWKGIKWILKKDAPLLIRPGLDLDRALWLARFLKHTANNDYARNTAETIRLGLAARKLYQEIIQEEKIEFDHTNCGILHIYKDREYFKAAQQAQKIYTDNGCEWEIADCDRIYELEPALKNVKNIIGGAWTSGDSTGDIHIFCRRMQEILEKKYKVKFCFEHYIDNVVELYDHDIIVVSNGVDAVRVSRSIGDKLPIYPVKGYSITLDIQGYEQFCPRVSLLDDQTKIVSSRLGSRFRVAGTAELAGENYDIRHDRIQPLLHWVRTNFPDMSTENYMSWACLRPMTPNMMPIVQQSQRNDRVWYHTGHGHLGWTLAPATAKNLTDQFMI